MTDSSKFDGMPEFEPLKVKCSSSKCDKGLHAFSPNRRRRDWSKEYEGQCRHCGTKLVDWDRVQRRDLSDVASVFDELKHELIRHVFFSAEFDDACRAEAAKLGRAGLKARVRAQLEKKISRAEIYRDGTQTPKDGSAINFGQHATATCCRKCIEYWHGIERGRALTPGELDYCVGLVCAYLDLRDAELFDQAADQSTVSANVNLGGE